MKFFQDGLAAVPGCLFHSSRLDRQYRQPLRQIIVQLARQSPALLFLSPDQAARQLLEILLPLYNFLFGLFARRDVPVAGPYSQKLAPSVDDGPAGMLDPADIAIGSAHAELNLLHFQIGDGSVVMFIPDPAIFGNDNLAKKRRILDKLPGEHGR